MRSALSSVAVLMFFLLSVLLAVGVVRSTLGSRTDVDEPEPNSRLARLGESYFKPIIGAWLLTSEPDRVHFIVTSHDGGRRHLYTSNTSALGRVLDAELKHLGYPGPKSAQEDESEGLPAET